MADRAPHDQNLISGLIVASNADGITPVSLWADPSTHALVISGSGGSSKSIATAVTTASVTTSSTSILASNSNRLGATIYNESGAIAYVKLGTTASLTGYTLQIAIGGYYEVPASYTSAIDGITSASTAVLRVTELT